MGIWANSPDFPYSAVWEVGTFIRKKRKFQFADEASRFPLLRPLWLGQGWGWQRMAAEHLNVVSYARSLQIAVISATRLIF